MTTSWDSLYLPSANQETVAASLRQALESLDYTLYNPFGILPGPSYQRTVRLFVSPTRDNWVRVIGSLDPRMMMGVRGLYTRLDGAEAVIEAYAGGNAKPVEQVLADHLRVNKTADHLRHVLYSDNLPTLPDEPASPEPTVVYALPEDIQNLAGRVNQGQAQQMIDRLSSNLLNKVGQRTGTDADNMSAAAQELLNQTPPDWNSPGGQRIRALMGCLSVPDSWRDPDFVALRDAYQLHVRRQRKPDARLYPGDEEAMTRVPDALDYIPVYGGRNA